MKDLSVLETINASNLDELMDFGESLAKDQMDATGEVLPLILAGTSIGHVQGIGFSTGTGPAGTALLRFEIGKFMREAGVEFYVVIAETWVSTDLSVKPSLSPDRKEAVILNGHDDGGCVSTKIFDIKRDGTGAHLEFNEEHQGNHVFGKWDDLLREPGQPGTTH